MCATGSAACMQQAVLQGSNDQAWRSDDSVARSQSPSRTCVVYCSAATNGASTSASSQTRRDLQVQGSTMAGEDSQQQAGVVPCVYPRTCSCAAWLLSSPQLTRPPICAPSLPPGRLRTLLPHYRHTTTHLSNACGSLEARLSTPTSRCCTYIGAAAMERAPLAYSARQSAKWGPLQCVGQHVGGVRSVRRHRAQQQLATAAAGR